MTDDLQLTSPEREVIRREFMSRFGEAPSVTAGFLVKRWATGANKGRPKLNTAIQGMLDRGLITITDEGHWPRANFTDRGYQALKLMAADRRALDPDRHRFLIIELAGISTSSVNGRRWSLSRQIATSSDDGDSSSDTGAPHRRCPCVSVRPDGGSAWA